MVTAIKLKNYLLGIDLGPSSIGWAVIELDEHGNPVRILAAGVRRFEAGVQGDIESGRDVSSATERRDARGPRRQHWRRQWRQRKVFRLLARHGLLPACDDDSHDARHQHLQELDASLREQYETNEDRREAHVLAYRLRAMALDADAPLDLHALGRAFYHLAQRRGFLSNRKAAGDDDERGAVKQGIAELADKLQQTGSRTLGEYFASLDPEEQRIRSRWTSRAMYIDEFNAMWNAQ
ncbi:MAG: hypothetical protein MI757_22450, partial [Pirellulales bacterium]|nr:hypothetical protein [Pirellulales bacterium]